jgi:hypothetical protein
MMGERTVMQKAPFHSFSLERHLPDDHLLRRTDRFADLSGLREHLRPYYSETGRPLDGLQRRGRAHWSACTPDPAASGREFPDPSVP